jgi:hypothetical protein
VGVLARTMDGKWRCRVAKLPSRVVFKEGKFHGHQDIVLLLSSLERKLDLIAAVSIELFHLDETTTCDIAKLDDYVGMGQHEELNIERVAELTEGKKEKLRCGSRGYINLIADERRLEVYEITDDK